MKNSYKGKGAIYIPFSDLLEEVKHLVGLFSEGNIIQLEVHLYVATRLLE
jgi:hypothetical protein